MAETDNSNGRDDRGRFAPGNSGGPGGSRQRACKLRQAAEEAITPEHVAAMIRKATRLGLEGNLSAMRFAFERTVGRPADAPVENEPLDLELPAMRTAGDCNVATQLLIDGLCRGEVDRDRAKLLIDAIQARLRAIELNELEERLTQLEQTSQQVKGR